MSFVDALPTVNAGLNALSGSMLLAGWVAVRRGNRALHWKLMAAAFIASTVFLVFYVIRFSLTGAHAFQGTGWVRPVYYAILFSHMALAAVVVPLAVRTLWLSAVRRSYGRHKLIARWTFPIWAYVSVTGVVVYLMLYHLPAA